LKRLKYTLKMKVIVSQRKKEYVLSAWILARHTLSSVENVLKNIRILFNDAGESSETIILPN